MKRLLIIGASGLTGYKLANLALNDYEVYGTYNKRKIHIEGCEISQFDKTDYNKTTNLIKNLNPDIIIDCSALHNVDYCENHQKETWNVNVNSTKHIVKLSNETNSRFIFISTDYVFDGKAKYYTEKSKPNPVNYYGLSKLKAEEQIAKICKNYAIARSSLVFGWNPGELKGQKSSSGKSMNFVIWALNKLRNNENLKIVIDQYSTPTLADNLAKYLLALANVSSNGIYHTVGRDCLNRYTFTLQIAETFDIDKELIQPVTSDQFKQVAKRPMRCCLNSYKAQTHLKVRALSTYESLAEMKQQETHLI